MVATRERTYSDEEVAERLQRENSSWSLEGGCIRRKIKTRNWGGTLGALTAIGHLAAAVRDDPDVTLAPDWLEVRLRRHGSLGFTERDMELVRRIEDVIAH
ncbi:MAG TPA: 4a-hydroxytetrahydrobiopterin dehydratase [Azospirillaceae bacterium]|nr:4a-hydroxytetrahydrobiopterin dehydratase [Azospirillaceae bacterium]